MPDFDLYRRWLDHLFFRPDTNPAWYFAGDNEFKADNETIVDLVSETFLRSGTDLQAFTPAQLRDGLSYIFHNYASNTIYSICQKGVAEEKRVRAVASMSTLYRDCLAVRCAPILSHLDEPGANPLNFFCYKLWDESPLCQWKTVVLDVMEAALYLPNPACVESALHGLSHRCRQSPKEVQVIIDKYLSQASYVRPELIRYALSARLGFAQ